MSALQPCLKLPPHSLQAEQSLIGGLLLDNAAWDRVADMIHEADFYRDDHRRIYRHIARLVQVGKPADVVTVFESLERTGEAERAGGLAYLGEIANNTPSAANIRRYAEIVRERATLRELQSIAGAMEAECSAVAGRPPEDIASEVEARILRLLDRSNTDPVHLQDVFGEVLADIESRRERGGALAGLATGFSMLDSMTGGLEAGQLIVAAARPAVGKTLFACNVAAHAASQGIPTLFFTLEMTRREIAARILAARSGVTVQAMRAGTNDQQAWRSMADAAAAAAAWPLLIDDTQAVSVPYARAKARRIQRAHGLGLLVVDYIGLMRGTGDNRAQEIGSVSRGLKALAKELRVPVIALAQLNRASESRQDKHPVLADLRDSGEVEQDADIVLMLHREELHNKAAEWSGLAELLIRKNRNGPTGECLLTFDGPHMRFASYSGPHPQQASFSLSRRKGFDG